MMNLEDLGGSCRGLFKVLSWPLLESTKKKITFAYRRIGFEQVSLPS